MKEKAGAMNDSRLFGACDVSDEDECREMDDLPQLMGAIASRQTSCLVSASKKKMFVAGLCQARVFVPTQPAIMQLESQQD